MTKRFLIPTGLLLGGVIALACSNIDAPSRAGPVYDWRLFVPFDSLGPRLDTLNFHWPRSALPLRIWVEDAYGMPGHVQHGINVWRDAFLYGEYDARLVSDSLTADVLVRAITPPPFSGPAPSRLFTSLFPGCAGATDIDTVANRRELRVPVRVYVYPLFNPATTDLNPCFDITATHELGHSLGLFQHSADPNDVLFTDPQAAGLSSRDLLTVERLYHTPSDMVPVR